MMSVSIVLEQTKHDLHLKYVGKRVCCQGNQPWAAVITHASLIILHMSQLHTSQHMHLVETVEMEANEGVLVSTPNTYCHAQGMNYAVTPHEQQQWSVTWIPEFSVAGQLLW